MSVQIPPIYFATVTSTELTLAHVHCHSKSTARFSMVFIVSIFKDVHKADTIYEFFLFQCGDVDF